MKYSDNDVSLKSQQLSLQNKAAAYLQKNAPPSLLEFELLSLQEQYALFYELQTHQIELEMQANELLQTQIERDASYLRYVDLYNQAPIAYCTVNNTQLILQANLIAAKLFCMQPFELLNRPITDFIFKEDQDIYYFYRQQLKLVSASTDCELRMVKKDGSLFWAQIVGAITYDTQGEVEFRFVLSDTSQRRQTDKLLFDSGQKFQFLFDKSSFGITDCKMLYDKAGKPIDYQFINVNQAFINLFSLNPENKLATQVFPDIQNYAFDWIKTFATVTQTGTQTHFEQLFQFNHRWYDCIAYQSTRDHFVAMWMDITDRKTNEKNQLKNHEKISRYAKEINEFYEYAPCGYYSLDINGFFLHINKTALKWLNYNKHEIIGKYRFQDMLASSSRENFQHNFLQFQKCGEEHDLEVELIRKDGITFPALISSTAVYDKHGYYLMSRSTLYDLTEQKKMANDRLQHSNELEIAARHLVSSQEHLRQKISSELHDRTSPNLAAININLKVIAHTLSQENSIDLLERIEDTLALIADTTFSIRDICTEMRPPLLDYSGLATAIDSYVQQFTKRTNIAVQFDCANHNERYPLEVESQLFRIFQEALTNCLKHAKATSIIVTLSKQAHLITLTINDNGIGFDFNQLRNTGADDLGLGLGLGLLNMQDMAEVIGASFYLNSAPGKGTQISVKLLGYQLKA